MFSSSWTSILYEVVASEVWAAAVCGLGDVGHRCNEYMRWRFVGNVIGSSSVLNHNCHHYCRSREVALVLLIANPLESREGLQSGLFLGILFGEQGL